MMDKDFSKKGFALLLSLSLLANTCIVPIAYAREVFNETSVVEEYDPFAEDIKKEPEKPLTMKERLAKMKAEEERALSKSKIDGVKDGHVYIPKGVKLRVELVEEATSKKMKKYQPIEFKMLDNLIINGVIVIPKGTLGTGYVYEVQKAGGFGRKGVLRIAGKEIRTINNIAVPLKQGLQGKGKTDGGAVAVAAAVSLVGGLFMKGSNITYPAGTDFEVEVRSNVDLQTTPENLAKEMDPTVPQGIEINVVVN